MVRSRKHLVIALVFGSACSPGGAARPADSTTVVRQARLALPSDTGAPMRVASYRHDSAGVLVEFEVTPPAGFAVLGGGIMVRVPPQGLATVVGRSR